ncbi:hypothetical protein FMUAM8_27090 [Nocardia cyriacigeorgica]|nr:hypothetical protein FMUAM8_27090 [Nocardia cyriacigeorgica]BDU06438.1 hypothetical protein FMUBM48_27010 [Nocardia cyriacigeorgica]
MSATRRAWSARSRRTGLCVSVFLSLTCMNSDDSGNFGRSIPAANRARDPRDYCAGSAGDPTWANARADRDCATCGGRRAVVITPIPMNAAVR